MGVYAEAWSSVKRREGILPGMGGNRCKIRRSEENAA